jgi:UDP-glucose:(heptosyl)LPS alpha-1,3-glucosyltransferase
MKTKDKLAVTLIKAELFKQGGLEKYTWEIAHDFCAQGCDVTVLTSGSVQAPFSNSQLNIVAFPIHHIFSFSNVVHFDKACAQYLAKNPSPIIFGLDRNSFQTHLRAGNGAHAAYLSHRSKKEGFAKRLSFAVNPLHRSILSLEKKGFEHPELKILFTNSFMVKQEILNFYCTDPNKIQVVHNGVEWHAMQYSFDQWESQKERTLKDLKLDPGAFHFIFIGHNFLRKGLDKLLFALALIKNEHFQLSVIGKDKNASYFEALVHRLGLTRKVFFFGAQKQTARFYQMADCLVIPSLYDPFANVTVEALAMGLFTISSKGNGGHEILNPENGIVVESVEDSISFSQTLEAALAFRKTASSAYKIRQTVKHLDFPNQLRCITEVTINSVIRLENSI